MTKTETAKVIDGQTYTATPDGTYLDPTGGEWVREEAGDIRKKIRWAEREMAKLAKRDLTDLDTAVAYTEALEIRTAADEDLRLVELLFG
jgi:hypothetical protein